MSNQPAIIIVDDDLAIMKCVGSCLEREAGIRVLGYAEHAHAGIALALELAPDVVLMDIHMPGADAFWACREIVRKSEQRVRVLFYTGFPRDHYIDRCYESGGAGMASKHTESIQDIGLAIRHVAKGHRYFSRELTGRLVQGDVNAPRSRLSELSEREVEILRSLAFGRTNREIAKDMTMGLRSVEKAIFDIKKKLEIGSTNELLVFAANEGIVYPELAKTERQKTAGDKSSAE